MISRLVGIEQQRFAKLGYETITTPVTIEVRKAVESFVIGNDTYLLTGVQVSESDMIGTTHRISIISPTGAITGTAREVSMLGTSTNVLFKNNIVVKVTDSNGVFDEHATIAPCKLYFIKVSPTKVSVKK